MKISRVIILFMCIQGCMPNHISKTYQGTAWKTQIIPGKVECEFYDRGGENIAYHDMDSINNGSGKLNPANGNFLNEFRMNEGVDISYTKTNNIDDNPFNLSKPLQDQLYVGWTKPGEWINYSVVVRRSGLYTIALMYTSNGNGTIEIDIDGKPTSGPLKVSSTHNDADTVAWRQWHHWNKTDSLTTLDITKGKHVLTLHTTGNGNMNFDYIEFKEQL
jgi:hypothetical protein